MAVATIVDYLTGLALPDTPATDPAAVLAAFRRDLYQCLARRADVLFELTDALLCAGGPVYSLVDLTLTPEHRRGHGALYDGLNNGRIDIDRLRSALAGLPSPPHKTASPHCRWWCCQLGAWQAWPSHCGR